MKWQLEWLYFISIRLLIVGLLCVLSKNFTALNCAYGAGLIAYIGEIVARTEQYFCPIKHARKVLGTHSRYAEFLAYGDAEDFEDKLEKFRVSLTKA